MNEHMFPLVIKGSKMNQYKCVFSFAWIVALLVATPAMGQLANYPVLSLAPGSAYGTTSVGVAFGRGVRNNSLDESVFVARVERGLKTVSFGATAGYIASDPYKLTLSGSIAGHLLRDSSPVQVSLQTGLGWIRQDILNLNLTTLHIPVGVAIQANGFGNLRPWVMPRVSFFQSSGNAVVRSSTATEFGGSAGISYASEVGVGFNLSFDYLHVTGGTPYGLSAGLSYIRGG